MDVKDTNSWQTQKQQQKEEEQQQIKRDQEQRKQKDKEQQTKLELEKLQKALGRLLKLGWAFNHFLDDFRV